MVCDAETDGTAKIEYCLKDYYNWAVQTWRNHVLSTFFLYNISTHVHRDKANIDRKIHNKFYCRTGPHHDYIASGIGRRNFLMLHPQMACSFIDEKFHPSSARKKYSANWLKKWWRSVNSSNSEDLTDIL